jgi:hypothetical protein
LSKVPTVTYPSGQAPGLKIWFAKNLDHFGQSLGGSTRYP